MGHGCSKVPVQHAISNPEDAIGTVLTVPGGCAPLGTGVSYLSEYIPDNGEYSWAGEGSACYFCSFDKPNSIGCSVGCDGISCCAIVGHTGTYKRTSYKADPKQCCLQSASTIGNLTCDPKYRNPTSSNCYEYVKDYCLTGDNIFTADVCASWCANNVQECNQAKSKICNDPSQFTNGYCKDWCLQNPGLCDTSATMYCSKDKTKDTFCSCLNSDLMKYKYNPLCEDKNCISHGYATQSMITSRGQGCQIVDCNTYFNVSAGGKTEFQDLNIQQRCGSKSSALSSSNINYGLLGVIGIVILCIIIALIYFFYLRK
jgi:hypothetical protein